MRTATHHIPGLVLTDHWFDLPLDHAAPRGEQIRAYAREVTTPDQAGKERPWLVFFQGGPGFGSPRPDANSGWLKRALKDYRVLLLDQRGTGRSTPVTVEKLAQRGPAAEQAAYTMHFRADSIIRDAELIRDELSPGRPWSVLGQSFGGFCVTHYLSAAPEGLAEAVITGGLPPLTRHCDDIYQHTYRRVLDKNRLYFERYPEDAGLARQIVDYLAANEVRLPAGGVLTPRRFCQLGIAFGSSTGFEDIHYLLETAFVPGSQKLSYPFLRAFENRFSFETNPIYALLHEAEYCQEEASRWSAERIRAEFPEFSLADGAPVYFTGEMVYPWMFVEYESLALLKEAAQLLADYDAWPRLYDVERLAANTVPVAAAVYYNDMYVERLLSEETAARIHGVRTWVTNEYKHNGLRADGERLLDRLLGMIHGEV
jgi:pimeloyl-ACP methyl ester carboxylesterase